MTNEDFLRKFDAGEKFTRKEIKEMCWGEVGEVLKENIVDQGRWTISKELIFEVDSRFFSVFWTEGATEQQYDCEEYPDYPTEVRRVEKVAYDYVQSRKITEKKEENYMKETRPLFLTYTAIYYVSGYYDDPPSTSRTEGYAIVKFPKPLATEKDFEELQNILKEELNGSPSKVIINNFRRLEHPE